MNKFIPVFTFLLFSYHNYTHAQTAPKDKYFFQSTAIDVKVNGKNIPSAWCGGMNNPQFAMGDLNNDKKNDLVIYEEGQGVKTFINIGVAGAPVYQYQSKYEANFPSYINTYLKLEDYDRDGIPDLIHENLSGFGIFKGDYNANNELYFKYYKDLYYLASSGWINAYVQPGSIIPGVADIDHDGDLDFMAFDVQGSVIQYYRNCQVEDNLPKDSIRICLKDNCWGKVYQQSTRTQILANSCQEWGVTCNKSTKTTHGGNLICLLDYDGDGDYDYFNGNVGYPDIQLLINGKADYNYPVDTMISQDTSWSANGHKLYLTGAPYPSAFWLDIDNDGDHDLLFSTLTLNSENHRAYFYKNIGSDNHPNFMYQSDSFMLDQMIDLGSGSYPAVYDYNKDGKPDLILGSDGYWQADGTLKSKLSYFENTSTKGHPSFELKTNDLLNISTSNISGAAPSFGDLDNDGKDDLVLGLADGTIQFFRNNASSNTVVPDWQYVGLLQITDINGKLQNIDVGRYAAPFIYDIDSDGKQDLIVGADNGNLYYYQNQGTTAGTINLKHITDQLGGVKSAGTGIGLGEHLVPYIGKMDDSGIPYLMLGSADGTIKRYTGLQNGNTKNYKLLDTTFQDMNTILHSAPAFADADGNGMYEAFIGCELGGIKLYQQYFSTGIQDVVRNNELINLYPNPAKNILNVSWEKDFAETDINISIVSVTGQILSKQSVAKNIRNASVVLDNIPTGVYYCILQAGNNKAVKPVTILH